MMKFAKSNSLYWRAIILSVLLSYLSFADSSTLDEPSHFVSGIYDWNCVNRDLYYVNPPLARMCAALPAIWIVDSGELQEFVRDKPLKQWGGDAGEYLWSIDPVRAEFWLAIGRCTLIPFAVLGLWSTEAFAVSLFGRRSGAFSGWLYLACPPLLAAGHSIAADGVCATLVVSACYFFHKWLEAPTMRNALIAGGVLGAALLSKTLFILLVPLFPIAWLIQRWYDYRDQREECPRIGQLVAGLTVSWVMLNSGYAWQGILVPLEEYEFVSNALVGEVELEISPERILTSVRVRTGNRARGTFFGHLPVPIPAMYLYGIDRQKADMERNVATFIHGHWKAGSWDDVLWTAAIKLPIGIVCLAMLSVVMFVHRWRSKIRNKTSPLLFLSITTITLINLSQSGVTVYFRYLTPCLPLMCVLLSQLVEENAPSARLWDRLRLFASNCLLCFSVIETMISFPHMTAFCSGAVGGTWNGQNYYLGVNEYGQNLWRLESWLNKHRDLREHIYICEAYNQKLESITGIKHPVCPSLLNVKNSINSHLCIAPLQPGIYITTEFERKLFSDGIGNTYLRDKHPATWIAPGLVVFEMSAADVETIVNDIEKEL